MILSKILKILLTRDLKMISRAKKFCAREKIVRGDPYDFFSRAPIRNFGEVFVHVYYWDALYIKDFSLNSVWIFSLVVFKINYSS